MRNKAGRSLGRPSVACGRYGLRSRLLGTESRKWLAASAFALSALCSQASPVDTDTLYLSGRGPDDMRQWEFFCTGGRNSGRWTTIGVPSCWDMQGFGVLQYGYEFNKWNKTPSRDPIADEKGLYKYRFDVPEEWKGRCVEIVFEAAMTDAEVLVNGVSAGERHQGGFSPFRYDISDKLNYGKKANLLEVTVSKESADNDVNHAERRSDYWNFGGIFRPVYLVSRPQTCIERVAIDAGMDGRFKADCFVQGLKRGCRVDVDIIDGGGRRVASGGAAAAADSVRIDLCCSSPRLWTAETPNLYAAVFTLRDRRGRTLHTLRHSFGFRTVEFRRGEGFFVNGARVKMKGVNRHSFRPESGRTLSYADNLEDVLLIKSMNMNAVRLSHYPADACFYDLCDSLGLYVIDELTGWQHKHKTEIGRKLVRELVTRDVNHPSVVVWASGNEGGFNYELEPSFKRYDIQKREIIYPWSVRDGINTRHYRSWAEMRKYLRGTDIVMPTEFLHGLYDGGLGAGLYDYWKLMGDNPRCAGGFLWALVDEGVAAADRKYVIDTDSCFGPDGLVGPHHEREASYYTVKQIWSPVQVLAVNDGNVTLLNAYDFLNLNTCRLAWRYLRLPTAGGGGVRVLSEGLTACPFALPHDSATVGIGSAPQDANAVELTVTDGRGDSLFTWCLRHGVAPVAAGRAAAVSDVVRQGDSVAVSNGGRTYVFSRRDGLLKSVSVGGRRISLANGPRLVAARRADRTQDKSRRTDKKRALATTDYPLYADSGRIKSFAVCDTAVAVTYEGGSMRQVRWTFLSDASVRVDYSLRFDSVADMLGVMFDYPEAKVKSKRWVGQGPHRVWQNRVHGPQYGCWETAYNDPVPGETFVYPEFKGYFADVDWMEIVTTEGTIGISAPGPDSFVGVYRPRDGRDNYLYNLPESGLSVLRYIPAVRNKVDYSDLNGPSAQPHWCSGDYSGSFVLTFK